MEFRIADSFIDSLTRLTNQEQKAVKTTVFDLQVNPANPGLNFHKLDRAQDDNFATVRVNRDLRLIVHRSRNSMLVCYVGHHDKAYEWAQRRKLEIHPKTGAAQLVEIRETVQEIVVPTYVAQEQLKPMLFISYSNEDLLAYGVPAEWIEDVKGANEDSLLELTDHLPKEAAEALLELAVGGSPSRPPVAEPTANPFEHPDALRRFRVMTDLEELERALEYPWEKWTVFLHPKQREIVEADFSGPARVSGSAGTGKTVVALHRAVFLAKENSDSRILLATFSETLANALKAKLHLLVHKQPRLIDQIETHSLNAVAGRLFRLNIGSPNIPTEGKIKGMIENASRSVEPNTFNPRFLVSEWELVVDAWQLKTWEGYRDVPRLGRKTRLPEKSRALLWEIFSRVLTELEENKYITAAQIYGQLTHLYSNNRESPFDFIVVDESQDINVPQLRFLAVLANNRPNSLFFAGDLGQRIFQNPFSWKAHGVNVQGRSITLNINYRTSHQIRMRADKLLDAQISDVDGNVEERGNAVSIFNGPQPVIRIFDNEDLEIKEVASWLKQRVEIGVEPDEIGIFVRSKKEQSRAEAALNTAGLPFKVLDKDVSTHSGSSALCTMHLAKGLEFRSVVVMACDDEVIPSQERIDQITDDADLEEIYNTERHLLYVACTRARDHLLVSGTKPGSEFLEDLISQA